MITWNLDPTMYSEEQLEELLSVIEKMDADIAAEISNYLTPVPEETIPVTLATIKRVCGWNKYCDVTGVNHYMMKEWDVSDNEIFNVKISHAKQLGL